jgi:hypothetical protein
MGRDERAVRRGARTFSEANNLGVRQISPGLLGALGRKILRAPGDVAGDASVTDRGVEDAGEHAERAVDDRRGAWLARDAAAFRARGRGGPFGELAYPLFDL